MGRRKHGEYRGRGFSDNKLRQLEKSLGITRAGESPSSLQNNPSETRAHTSKMSTLPERSKPGQKSRIVRVATAIGRPILNRGVIQQSTQRFSKYGFAIKETPDEAFVEYVSATQLERWANMSVEEAYESYVNAAAYDAAISERTIPGALSAFTFKPDRRFVERGVIIDDEYWQQEVLPLRRHLIPDRHHLKFHTKSLRLTIGKITLPGHAAWKGFNERKQQIIADQKVHMTLDAVELGRLGICWREIDASSGQPVQESNTHPEL